MAEYSKGIFQKKTINPDGTESSKPFLPKTLADLVVTSDGGTVEKKIVELASKKSYIVYDTYAEYEAAYTAGEIPAGTMCVVLDR